MTVRFPALKTLTGLAVVGTTVCTESFAQETDDKRFHLVIEPFMETYCLDCHDDATHKGRLSLENIDPDLLGGDDFEIWRMIDDQIRFGEMPPKEKLQPEPAEMETVLSWLKEELLKTQQPGMVTHEKLGLPQFGNYVDHQELFTKRRSHVDPAPPRLWRLRPAIYDSIIPTLPSGTNAAGFANGLNVNDGSEFKDYASAYFLDEAGTQPLLGNARKVAAVMLGPKSRDRACLALVGESTPTPQQVAEAIKSVFQSALGRKPTAEEITRFSGFHAKATVTGGNGPAAEALIVAIIMQPEVLFRQEIGEEQKDAHGRRRLTQREISYALSYALSDHPVEEFIRAAAEGDLANSGQVAATVEERLKDDSLLQDRNPRVLQFFREYFNYPFATEVFKDRPERGDYDPGLLVADLETTIRDILREDVHVLAELLTTRKFYLNANYKGGRDRKGVRLMQGHQKKPYYHRTFNLPLDWKWDLSRQPIEFPADERMGILTHPAWLAAWSGNFENHPVQRGKWIRTHLLGGTVPDVPIGVDARVPEKENLSFRNRLKIATREPECWRCHKKMDPLGVTFERYDHFGRYQRLDAGQPVDPSGLIDRTGDPELDGTQVESPMELMQVLSKSTHVEQVFVRHVFRYFMGRNESLGDANTLQDAHRSYRESGGSFRALVTSILSSDSFLYQKDPESASIGEE